MTVRRALVVVAVLLVWAVWAMPAQANDVRVYFFWGNGCPHCRAEIEFLSELESTYPELRIFAFEIYENMANVELLQRIGEKLAIDVRGVPVTIIGDVPFIGFSRSSTGAEILAQIEACRARACPDPVAPILAVMLPSSAPPASTTPPEPAPPSDPPSMPVPSETPVLPSTPPIPDLPAPSPDTAARVTVPVFGTIDARTVSLPLLAIVMGAIDGFNPCALWTLLFLLSLLIGMRQRARMWILGTTFIVASAAVYFAFMVAWLELILFLGMVFWVRLAIGAAALAAGGYALWRARGPDTGCVVTGDERRERFFAQMRGIVRKQAFLFALLGIIVLAFAVNLVELVCSAGLPAVFTNVLALNALPTWKSYALIALYILFFMIDDLFVFLATMTTLQLTGITTRYARTAHIVGGVLMLLIGTLMIVKPEWLLFG